MATKYWVGVSAAASNWNSTGPTPWSDTDGGANNATAPTATDDVVFNGNGAFGNANNTISNTRTCLSLTVTAGYTGTRTHNAVLTVSGNITFGANETIAGSSSMTMSATGTITSNGKTWPNSFTSTNTKTITLSGDFVISGTLTLGNGVHTINKTASETLSVGGFTQGNGALNGTLVKLIITGGTWSTTSASALIVTVDVDLQGNITIPGNIYIQQDVTLTYVSGTITSTGSILNIINTCTLNTAGILWETVNINSNNPIITINSLLSVSGTISISVSTTFTGTSGFTCHTLTHTSANTATITLEQTVTYTVTNSLTANTSRVGSILLFTSSHASNKAIMTLQRGATCALLANMTRIDASGGRPLRSFNGTITDCINIESFHDLLTVAA